jgi:hypothetical protein
MEFDFEAWTKLAKEDPEAFERQREEILRALIASAPPAHRQRLEGLQFRLNVERERARTPLGACVRLNSLMWAGFHRLRKELNGASQGTAQEPRTASAKIIALPVVHSGNRSKAGENEER